ncbi:MAG: hypothetical protein IPL61_06915 [Myxococcales bacterium]|nr:hypothetical protein [Myxococcales bacterium]
MLIEERAQRVEARRTLGIETDRLVVPPVGLQRFLGAREHFCCRRPRPAQQRHRSLADRDRLVGAALLAPGRLAQELGVATRGPLVQRLVPVHHRRHVRRRHLAAPPLGVDAVVARGIDEGLASMGHGRSS